MIQSIKFIQSSKFKVELVSLHIEAISVGASIIIVLVAIQHQVQTTHVFDLNKVRLSISQRRHKSIRDSKHRIDTMAGVSICKSSFSST